MKNPVTRWYAEKEHVEEMPGWNPALAGLRREAHLRQNIFFHRDEQGRPVWKDTCVYAVLDTEYMQQFGNEPME